LVLEVLFFQRKAKGIMSVVEKGKIHSHSQLGSVPFLPTVGGFDKPLSCPELLLLLSVSRRRSHSVPFLEHYCGYGRRECWLSRCIRNRVSVNGR
jgi:hypothetical protein